MIEIIFGKVYSVWNYLFNKGGIILAAFLTAIGFPSQVIYFIMCLVVADVLTRWYAEVRKKYGSFNIVLFFRAWGEKTLNSKKLKMGVFTKIFFYAILLYIAYQAKLVPELAFGKIISDFIYSSIIILDLISIVENMVDSGYSKFKPMVAFLKAKLKDLFGSSNQTKTESSDNESQG